MVETDGARHDGLTRCGISYLGLVCRLDHESGEGGKVEMEDRRQGVGDSMAKMETSR